MEAGGDHGFHFVHVRDVARAAVLAADCARPERPVFNITGGSQVTLQHAGQMIGELIPGARIEIGPGYWHLDRQGPWDITAAGRDLGYEPEYPLERGLPEYVGWLRDHEY